MLLVCFSLNFSCGSFSCTCLCYVFSSGYVCACRFNVFSVLVFLLPLLCYFTLFLSFPYFPVLPGPFQQNGILNCLMQSYTRTFKSLPKQSWFIVAVYWVSDYTQMHMFFPPVSHLIIVVLLSPYISQINLKTGMCGMKANSMTVTKKLVCPSRKRFFVLVSLWTTITMLFVRTFYQDMPRGVALLEDYFTTPQLKLPKTADLRPCWMSVPTQRSDTVDSKPQKNCVNTLHNWVTMWGSPQWKLFATLAKTLLQRHIENEVLNLCIKKRK